MSIVKLVSGAISILVSGFLAFQFVPGGLGAILPQNGDFSGTAGAVLAAMLLINGAVSIVMRNSEVVGNILTAVFCGIGAAAGLVLADRSLYMLIGSGWGVLCLLLAVVCLLVNQEVKLALGVLGFTAIFALGVLLGMFSGGLTRPAAEAKVDKKPESLVGEWQETGGQDRESWQMAVISENTIEVYWVSGGGRTKSLYWAGSYEPPETLGKEYTWTSENDRGKTGSAPMASGEETKEFTYKSGKLQYSVSILGTTQKLKLEKTA